MGKKILRTLAVLTVGLELAAACGNPRVIASATTNCYDDCTRTANRCCLKMSPMEDCAQGIWPTVPCDKNYDECVDACAKK